ncbi:MAG: hypothetical protein ACU826_10265 [Gammaproteobacteria bacterium]
MACDHLTALDLAKAGKWDEAHRMVQPYSDEWSCLIHGYLHRLEGDRANARYWYVRAGADLPENSLEQEWQRLYALVGGNKSG